MSYLIYRIINKVNQKCYIGQTNGSLKKRWRSHLYAAFNTKGNSYEYYFAKAIRKYGKDNWNLEILEEKILTLELANKAEKYWINKFSSNIASLGYNSTEGGDACFPKPGPHLRKMKPYGNNKYLGVIFVKTKNGGFYRGEIDIGGKTYRSESSKDELLAAKYRDVMVLKLLGSEGVINFKPEENELLNGIDLTDLNAIKISSEEYRKQRKERRTLDHREKRTFYINKYIGVSFDKKYNNYAASIIYKGKTFNIGKFLTEEIAAKARDKKAMELLGKDCKVLNFPDQKEEILKMEFEKLPKNQNSKKHKNSKSKYLGVYKINDPRYKCEKYKASIQINGEKFHIGTFDNEEEAAHARDAKAIEILGKDKAILNFPLSPT